MSASPTPTPKNGSASMKDNAFDITKAVFDTMQQGVAVFMAIPQKMLQANLDNAALAVDLMNRRMKMHATLWNNAARFGDFVTAAEAQRTCFETLSKEYSDEIGQLTDAARRSLAAVSGFSPGSAGAGSSPSWSS